MRRGYLDLAAKKDHAGLVAHFRAHPAEALATIDGDLEGALALVEKGGDAKEIAAMHERALFGAKAADEAFGNPIFGDYVASYVGFDAKQQKEFREGQKLVGEASGALRKKDFETAKKAAARAVELTAALGDWWGLSSAHAVLADALEGAGDASGSLVPRQFARQIHHDLGFARSELRDTVALARTLAKLGRKERARFAVAQGLALAAAQKDAKAEAALKEIEAGLQ